MTKISLNTILTDEELEFLLSVHAGGHLFRTNSTGERYCALEALDDLYPPATGDIFDRYAAHHPRVDSTYVWGPFDDRYRPDMTPEQFLDLWRKP